jgi:hypothetical protein
MHNSNGRHDDPPFSRLRNVCSTLWILGMQINLRG